jgi:hypothetical protein
VSDDFDNVSSQSVGNTEILQNEVDAPLSNNFRTKDCEMTAAEVLCKLNSFNVLNSTSTRSVT